MSKTDGHASRAHSKLSASGSSRWINCPGSVLLESRFAEDRSSSFAKEGEAAHEFSELRLKFLLDSISAKDYKKQLSAMAEQLSEFYGPEMGEYVTNYTDSVMERYYAAHVISADVVMLLEQRLDYTEWVPDGFGTGDVTIISDKMLEIIDLKYGKGVPVSAVNNSQLKMYALGAISTFGSIYDFDTVRMTIIQPRLDSITDFDMSVADLLKWAEEVIRPKAVEALSEKGAFKFGDHCKWCKAKDHCRTRAFANLEMEGYEKKHPNLLTADELADVYFRTEALKSWAEDIKKYATSQMLDHGVKIPGLKVVEGKSSRFFTDEDAVALKLKDLKLTEEQIYKPVEMQSLTEIEKLLGGKKKFTAHLDSLVDKKPGKPTLAKEDDARPEFSPAASVFDAIDIED